MTTFQICDSLGTEGENLIFEQLCQRYKDVRRVPKDITHQLKWADIVIPGNESLGIPNKRIEVKTEQEHTGNLFWETWSDKPNRRGWGVTSCADELYYLFLDIRKGYRITSLQEKIWVFDYCKGSYKEVPQNKNDQRNESYGCLIPVTEAWLKAVEFKF